MVEGAGIVLQAVDAGTCRIINSGDRNAGDDVLKTSSFGGDVSGSFNDGMTVVRLQGNPLSIQGPNEGDVLTFRGGKWVAEEPAGGGNGPEILSVVNWNGGIVGSGGQALNVVANDNGLISVSLTNGQPLSNGTHAAQITPAAGATVTVSHAYSGGGLLIVFRDQNDNPVVSPFSLTITEF